jgi:RimJ/RimL family protein N-acetyltransferase
MSEPREAFPDHQRMPETPVLKTERLVLRPPREADVPAVQRRFSQWEAVRYLDAHIPWPYPDHGAAENWPSMQRDLVEREKCHWAITMKTGDDELIGLISVWQDDGRSRDQRGFWLDPTHWGRGLMTEAANGVTDYALVELGWPHLWLCNAEVSVASHRLKEKQGARIIDRTPRRYVSGDGVRVTWLLTREAWLAHRSDLAATSKA